VSKPAAALFYLAKRGEMARRLARLSQRCDSSADEVRFKRSFVSSFAVSPVLLHYDLRLPVLPASACELQALTSEGGRALLLFQLASRTRHAELRMSSQWVTAPTSTR